MPNRITAEVIGGDELDQFLAQLPFELRQRMLPKLLRANVRVLQKAARADVTSPGYRGDKDQGLSLQRNIVIRVKTYERAVVAVVGPTFSTPHSHLVEFGHRLVRAVKGLDGVEKVEIGYVQPHSYMRKNIDHTHNARHTALIARIEKEITKFQESLGLT